MPFTPAQDEWPVATSTIVATGPATTPGNLVVVRAVHRNGSGLPAVIGDNGDNTWHPLGPVVGGEYVGVVAGGSGDLLFWYCIVAAPFTAVTVEINRDPALPRILFVREWAGVDPQNPLVAVSYLANPSLIGPLPTADVTTAVAGTLVSGALAATVSNRTFTLLTPDYMAGREHRTSQTTLISATRVDAPPGTHGPQWQLGGSASTTAVLTAAFRPAGGSTPPAAGTGTVAHSWATSAAGATSRRGSGATAHQWTGGAAGAASSSGVATSSHQWATAAAGQAPHAGTATEDVSWTVTAAGAAPAPAEASGTATTAHRWAVAAAGARQAKATAAADVAWAATATGAAPAVAGASGAGSVTAVWGPSATGSRPSRGAAVGVYGYVNAAAGATPRRGAAQAAYGYVVAAAGSAAGPRDITLDVTALRGHPLTVGPPELSHPLTVTAVAGNAMTVLDVRT